MKKVQLSNLQLAYRESNGKEQAVILVHGNSASSQVYQRQLQNSPGKKYRIVAIDLPGHGDSDRLPDLSHYNLPNYATIIAEAATKLGMEDAVFVGWSLGGHIVLEAVKLLPKAKGFIIFGTPPIAFPPDMEGAFLPNPAVNTAFTPEISQADAIIFADSFFVSGKKAPIQFVEDILRTDSNARAGLGASIQPDAYEDEVEVVANMKVPLAIFHGAEEQLLNGDYFNKLNMPTLWRNKVQMIKNAGHAAQWEKSRSFNALLNAFVEDVK